MAPKKDKKPVGLRHPQGKYLKCTVCKTRRMSMHDIKKHQAESGCRPKRRPKPAGTFSTAKLKREGKLSGLSDKHVERGIAIGTIFDDPTEMRRVVSELFDRGTKRRKFDFD